MTTDYLSKRQNVVQGPAAELNSKLIALASVFDEAWLEANGTHPLQSLWSRQDALATNELLNFGDAVERLHQEDPTWLKGQVRIIKTGDAGQRAGAIFEIFALNLFSRDFCRVIAAPESMPGFDGTLILNDEARVLVSIKNHGQSSREQEFLAEAKAFDGEFQSQLASLGLRDLEVNVVASKHLDAASFRSLKADIATCLTEWKAGKRGGELERPYTIVLKGMEAQYGPLSAFRVSSSCRIMSPIARNEQANFEEAIRKGCENLFKQTKGETGAVCRMIILRLSNTASIARCREWASWYFTAYPDDPVDLILLYQAAVTTDAAANTSSIVHSLAQIPGPRFGAWQKKEDGGVRLLPNMSILVGMISHKKPTLLLTSDGVSGVDMSNYYVYQRADAFQRVEFVEGVTAALSNPASGIMTHAVFEQDGAQGMTLSSKAEREKVLVLLP